MNRHEGRKISPSEKKIRRSAAITVVCDILIIATLVVCLMTYIVRNNADTYDQNIDSISDIASASSQLIQTAIDSMSSEIVGAYNYCDGRSVQEILDYLSLVNVEDSEYQLLRHDEISSSEFFHVFEGYSTRKDSDGAYLKIEYEDTALCAALNTHSYDKNGVVAYSQSFTNKTDAMRYFAVFCGLNVNENGDSQQYYLIKPQKESRLLAQAQTITQYKDVSVAICYPDGKYLAKDNGFRAENFYDYLYQYNGLTLDEKNELRSSVQNDWDGAGMLAFRDHQKRDCIYAYKTCGNDGSWHVIVSVPTSEFVSEQLFSFFPLIIIVFLAALLVFNVFRLLVIVKQLRQSVQREREASAAKGNFMSRMSHEIRTPLNAVIGYNTIACDSMSAARTESERRQAEMKVMDCLSKSGIASRHLLTIINDVLDMSAIESGKIKVAHERFDFKGLITSLTTVFYSQAKAKNIRFEVIFGTLTEEWFVGDQMRVNQILTNLLSNAIKFTPGGGSVVLRVNQPEAEVNSAHIHFDVEDTGIGMAPEYLEHIWAPFEQADSSISRRFGGTGLGLSITKNLVDIMNGRITVESTPGKGSRFGVDLEFEKTAQPECVEACDFSGINALIVDDDQSTCDYIRLIFNRSGARCAAVTSGEDALKAVAVSLENNELFSICIIDWRMPGMDGIETIRRIRELVGDGMPIIVLTAYDYSEIADEASRIGVSRFIAKPLFQSSLFDLLANISAEHPQRKPVKTSAYDFGGVRVLLAEDNEMNMEIAKTIMESEGLEVDIAWNGREALDKFIASEPGTYSAILMDVHMPEMNGHDASRAIRASAHSQAQTIPIIAMTADAFAENVVEAREAGMNGHIAKPIDIQALFEILRRYIQN